MFRYYADKERFIKIYGGEKCSNIIHLEAINDLKKYNICIDNSEEGSSNLSTKSVDKICFSKSSYIITKKKIVYN